MKTLNKVAGNIKILRAQERGHTDIGWLDSYHSFSFGEYYDPKHMSFRSLRVINDDRIAPGQGFGAHPHNDMEIITYIIEGAVQHKDSMGNGSIIREGDVQRMSAGTGVMHSEFNASKDKPLHLLQIWIVPEKKGLAPSYQELNIKDLKSKNGLTLLASGDGKDGVIKIHQDVRLYRGNLSKGKSASLAIAENRGVWIQIISGGISVKDNDLKIGDGISIENETGVEIKANEDTEFLLFDLK